MSEIWLDTNILWQWNLRLNTAEAEKFLKVCEGWGYEILVPEVVLSELAHQYARKAEETLRDIDRSKGHLASLEIDVAEEPWARPPPDLPGHYREIITRRCEEKSITIVPFEEVSAHKLFDMSVKRIPPFEATKGERGFHDALILFSVLERARQKQQAHAILISNDGIFKDEAVQALAKESDVDLYVHESVDAFIAYVNALFEEAYQEFRREREVRALSFLLGHRSDIERFIEQKAAFGERFLSGDLVAGTIKHIVGISLRDITEVTVLPAKKESALRFLTFTARLEILLETDVSPFSQIWRREPKQYRVGQEPEEQPASLPPPGRKTIPVTRDVVCEATAIEHVEEETFSNLEMKEVKVPDRPLRGLLEALSPPGL